MGFLDGLENMAGQQMQQQGGNANASVAGGLLQELEQHPGGLGGLMNTMQQNGVDAQGMAAGQAGATPQQVNQGLDGSGLIEKVAARAGVSPQVATEALAVVLPMMMAHFTQGGTAAPPSSGLSGMAGGLLSRLL